MLSIGIIITIVIGFLIIKSYDSTNKLNASEVMGLTFPLGLFTQVMVLTALDYLALPITVTMVTICNVIILVGLLFYMKVKKIELSFDINFNKIKEYFLSKNLVWGVLLLLVIYFEYLNFSKCMYYPTFDRDSLAAFDTLGYIFAKEHCISNISLFDENYNLAIKSGGSYIAYPPFTQVAYAFVYLLGANTSKLIPALLFASFIFALYGALEKEIKPTGAILITFLAILTPEMIAFSSLSGTNVIHAIYASLGTIYAMKWIINGKTIRDEKFWSSALLLSANFLVRTEGVIFIGATGLFILIMSIKDKAYKNLIIWGLVTILPAVIWKIHQSVTGMTTENFVITELFYDSEKAGKIISTFQTLFSTQVYYGWSFIVLACSCIITLFYLKKSKTVWIGWAILSLSVIGYGLVIYQVDYVWDSIENVLNFSSKRFFFSFIPIAWYIAATNYPIARLFEFIDNSLCLNKTK